METDTLKVHLDTHVFLMACDSSVKMPRAVSDVLKKYTWVISPMVHLECWYLFEMGRIGVDPDELVQLKISEGRLETSGVVFADVVRLANSMRWTRDPFDRIITATAVFEGAPLVTKDKTIQSHYARAFF